METHPFYLQNRDCLLLFTTNFNIISRVSDSSMHSACIAFGIERLLLVLLAHTLNYELDLLVENIAQAAAIILEEK
ncbi:hypothetical protein [Photorhabdus laumondii]|uniref:hypothetical protein n=1 Tax=Photorhabdus laumondii TaxID=2218628 RepID=UPI003315DA9B